MRVEDHLGTITEKGQITLPPAVRQVLGVKPRDHVTFRVTDGRVELLPARMSLESVYGAVKPRKRPENWKSAGRQAREERAKYRASITLKRR
ncbi:MAG: AbrB/MazE/SpoVT family DNA-binding domain-containing protein [Chloroflexi bacterium]|nr:AbrB/MazE/SpoVT family DNA-binding domain-containing protein [Chloroflexota bacterium]